MVTVNGMTAERMLTIENNSVVSGAVVGNNLILTKHGGGTINAGNVRGATGLPGISNAEFDAEMADLLATLGVGQPVGIIVDYIGLTAPVGWIALNGQTITNGETLYPLLWAVLPVSMKSGANIVTPNTGGRAVVGYTTGDVDYNAIGKLSGTKTHVLTVGETPLKSHNHVVDSHNHGGSTGNESAYHTHTQQGNFTSGMGGEHEHVPNTGGSFVTSTGLGNVLQLGATPMPNNMALVATTNLAGFHAHTVSIGGATGNENSLHTHAVTAQAPNTSYVSDASATAHNNVPPSIAFLKIMKAV
jgi:microcystin-dependent protein